METIESYHAWLARSSDDATDDPQVYLVSRDISTPFCDDLLPMANCWEIDSAIRTYLVGIGMIKVGEYAGVMVVSEWYERQEGNGKLPWKATTTVTLAGKEIYHAVVCTEQVRLPEPLTAFTADAILGVPTPQSRSQQGGGNG